MGGVVDNFEKNYFFVMFLLFLDAEISLFATVDNNLLLHHLFIINGCQKIVLTTVLIFSSQIKMRMTQNHTEICDFELN